jgi:hypothetical protein
MSYGDELTLHFGILRESRSTKLRDRRYGTYILSFRGSPWVLKVGRQPEVLGSWFGYQRLEPRAAPRVLTKNDLERELLVEEGARVVLASPYLWKVVGGIGLHLVMSDGTTVSAIPTGPDEPDDAPWPELASWELLGPHGLLKVGPGVTWEFVPSPQTA